MRDGDCNNRDCERPNNAGRSEVSFNGDYPKNTKGKATINATTAPSLLFEKFFNLFNIIYDNLLIYKNKSID